MCCRLISRSERRRWSDGRAQKSKVNTRSAKRCAQCSCCRAAGAVVVIVVVSLAVWAIAGEFTEKPRFSSPTMNFAITEKSVAPNKSLTERRGLIVEQSGSEGVRIFATVNTGRPVPISQTQLQQERSQFEKEVIDFQPQLPPPINSDSLQHTTDEELAKNAMDNLKLLAESLKENGTENIPNLFEAFNQYFRVDLSQEEPDLERYGTKEDIDQPDWLTLTYLGASIFLLKQIDTLLQLQPTSSREFRGTSLEQQPWNFNSLNLLFMQPGNVTDVREAVHNNMQLTSLKEYLWAARNIYVASQQLESFECLWTAYCEEINNRATMQGITGTMARMNGVVMEMMSGWLSPPAALSKLARSVFQWSRADCAVLFPACPPKQAAQYLMHLATTPVMA